MSILAALSIRSQAATASSQPLSEEERCSESWRRYFHRNQSRLLHIPWELGVELTPRERDILLPSIQDFQLGESSDGSNGREMARQYAESSGDERFVDAMELFIAEEGRHGRDLGRYLDLAGVPRLKSSWTSFAFRWLRNGKGVEMLLVTALMAELVAKVYYRAVFHASRCRVLRKLCAQLLRDERQHVEFDVERLRLMRQGRSAMWLGVIHAAQRILFAGTCAAVWLKHGKALRLGGYGLRRFWWASWSEYEKAERDMAGKTLAE
jgi:hypothetical protein